MRSGFGLVTVVVATAAVAVMPGAAVGATRAGEVAAAAAVTAPSVAAEGFSVPVSRLAGADRFATSAAVSAATYGPGVAVAYIASGLSFPDALSAAPVAGRDGGPLLLVSPTAVPPVVAAELHRLDPGRIVVLGGTGVVSAAVAAQLTAYTTGTVTRLAGADRFATSAAVSAASYAPGVPVVYVANGYAFADALSGAPAAATQGGPLLLVGPTAIPTVVAAELQRLDPGRIAVLGGVGVVSSTVAAQLTAYTAGPVHRLAGPDRFATSAAVSAATFRPGPAGVYVASGLAFPDALSGAAAAGTHDAPLLLVAGTEVPDVTERELERLKPAEVLVVGGTGVVSTAVQRELAAHGPVGMTLVSQPDRAEDRDALYPAISADGRVVAYESNDPRLVPDDSNRNWDVFVHDRVAGTTTRASVSSAEAEADDRSDQAAVSGDGTVVAFHSWATNLVAGDTNASGDVFVRDLAAGTTTRVLGAGNVQADAECYNPRLSADGRFVAFSSGATNLAPGSTGGHVQAYVRDRVTGAVTRESVSSGGAVAAADAGARGISADGRYLLFASTAANLVPGDTNGAWDLFVRDRQAGTTTRASLSTSGAQLTGPSAGVLSADGRHVAFVSLATNVVPGDTNDRSDVFVRDLDAGTTVRASVSSTGVQGNANSANDVAPVSLSGDGRYVAFESFATNLVPDTRTVFSGVYLRDVVLGLTTRVSVAADGTGGRDAAGYPAVSADGRYVALVSVDADLVPGPSILGDPDVYLARMW